jgi:hypothetical protein
MNYSDDNRKHFDYLQAIITRMNTNSFMIKGWTVTIVSALLALAASTKNTLYLQIAYFPVLMFWILDSFYLTQERKFRILYQEATTDPSKVAAYSLKTDIVSVNKDKSTKYFNVFFSPTILPFYLLLVIIIAACICFSQKNSPEIKEPLKVNVVIGDTVRIR